MTHDLQGYSVWFPRAAIYLFREDGLHDVWPKADWKRANPGGKFPVQMRALPSYTSLGFTHGLQLEAVKPVDFNQLEVSGKTLVEIMMIHGAKRGLVNFDMVKAAKAYFDGSDLNRAQTYIEEVANRLLTGRTDTRSAWANVAIAQERAIRGAFWDGVFPFGSQPKAP